MPFENIEFLAETQSVCAPVSFTVVGSKALMTKTIALNASGRPEKTNPPPLASGDAQRATLEGDATAQLEAFGNELIRLTPREAIICAPPPPGRESWKLVSRKNLAASPGAIARTDENFQPQSGPALLGLDFDTADFPVDFQEKIANAGGWHAALKLTCKAFDSAAMLERASVSSGLTINGGPPEKRGFHCYFIASDGMAARDFVRTLADRLMLGGFMWAKMTKTGLVVPCTLFDVAASGDASRLWYEADGILSGDGLAYAPDARTPRVHPGGVLDVTCLAPLSEAERAGLDQMRATLVQRMEPQAALTREAWTTQRMADMIAKGKSPEVAARILSGASQRHELPADFEILLDEGGWVTVREIRADPSAFHRKTCADPLEPDYGSGRNLAIIYTDGRDAHIVSQAHGGIDYRLCAESSDWFDAIEDAPGEGAPDDPGSPAQVAGARRFLPVISFAEAAAKALAEGGKPLVKGLLDQGAMSVIYGASNTGKTFLGLKLGFHVAAGLPFAGMKVAKGRVLYVAAEGGVAVYRRLEALRLEHPAADNTGFHLIASPVDLRNPRADLQPLIDAAKALGHVDLIVIDTLSRAMAGGDENSSVDMGALVANFDATRQATKAHVLVIHHTGKDAAKGARGHSLLRAATDTEIEIADGQLLVTKQRDKEGGFKIGFKLVDVKLGFDSDGAPVTSATVSFAAPDEVSVGKPTAKESLVLEAVRTCAANQSPGTGVSPQDVADILSSNGTATNKNTARTHLVNLAKKGLLVALGGNKWGEKPEKLKDYSPCSTPPAVRPDAETDLEIVTQAVRGIFD